MRILATCFASITLAAVPALAGQAKFGAPNAAYQSECGSCHVAYPARLLSAASWQALLAGLDKHFGTDAAVDAATMQEISAYLERSARAPRKGEGIPLRITETRWFVREHDEVPAATWRSPAVQSKSNCSACHTRAEQGDFSEASLRVPR
mgnify:CR=1 FL=1